MAFFHVFIGECIDEKIAPLVKAQLKLICQSKSCFLLMQAVKKWKPDYLEYDFHGDMTVLVLDTVKKLIGPSHFLKRNKTNQINSLFSLKENPVSSIFFCSWLCPVDI